MKKLLLIGLCWGSSLNCMDAKLVGATLEGDLAVLKTASSENICAVDSQGYTLMHIAAQEGHTKIIKFLYDQGVSVNACTTVEETPLMLSIAKNKNQTETVNLLLRLGAKVNMVNHNGIAALYEAAEFERSDIVAILILAGAIVPSNKKYQELLIKTFKRGNAIVAQQLLDAGVALECLKKKSFVPGSLEAAKLLIRTINT